jgi:hypothetical protein
VSETVSLGHRSETRRKGLGAARTALAAFAMLSALGAVGCRARLAPEPVYFEARVPTVVRADAVPYSIESYPRMIYGGTYVYLVDGRWYYPTTRWYYVYHVEPPSLARARVRIQADPRFRERAPRATRYYRQY